MPWSTARTAGPITSSCPTSTRAGDSAPGSIVELRRFDDAKGQRRVALAVRSDLTIEQQITATGATWLDRQAIAREPVALGGGGFGAEVREALDRRAEHLIGQGLAERQKPRRQLQPQPDRDAAPARAGRRRRQSSRQRAAARSIRPRRANTSLAPTSGASRSPPAGSR